MIVNSTNNLTNMQDLLNKITTKIMLSYFSLKIFLNDKKII
jgi:hypothetical protein